MIKSVEEFLEICHSKEPEVYTRFNNDVLVDEIAFSIITDHPDMASNVAENKTLSLNMINYLANYGEADIRFRIAEKPNLTRELFEKLACDPDESVRHRIVCNKNTPLDILEKLTHDEWEVCAEDATEILAERLAKETKSAE